jgi:hypothetical protein
VSEEKARKKGNAAAFHFLQLDHAEVRATRLRICSVWARILWLEMLVIMNEATPRGLLLIEGQPVDPATLHLLVAMEKKHVTSGLKELEDKGIFKRDGGGTFSSEWLLKQEQKRLKDIENGRSGGNPGLKADKPQNGAESADADNQGVNPQDNPDAKPKVKPPDKPGRGARVNRRDKTAVGAGVGPPDKGRVGERLNGEDKARANQEVNREDKASLELIVLESRDSDSSSSSSSLADPARDDDDDGLFSKLDGAAPGKIPVDIDLSPIRRVIAEGVSLELDILPCISDRVTKSTNTLGQFYPALIEAMRKRSRHRQNGGGRASTKPKARSVFVAHSDARYEPACVLWKAAGRKGPPPDGCANPAGSGPRGWMFPPEFFAAGDSPATISEAAE